jgi:hypothetical protein
MNSHDNDNDDVHNDGTEEPSESAGPRPLGYWLKAVDRLIDREFETAFADLDATRRDWRLLNLIGGEVSDERLRAKLDARPHRLLPLLERGWVAGESGAWTLTDAGRDALGSLGERVRGIRSRIGGAVSSDDYATTLASLEAIARGLGWTEADADAWSRRRPGRRGRAGWGMRPGFRRFGRPPFGAGTAGTPAPWMTGDRDDCPHHGHGHGHDHRHPGNRHAGHARFDRDGELHVHVHLDDPRGRRRGHPGHRDPRDHAEH